MKFLFLTFQIVFGALYLQIITSRQDNIDQYNLLATEWPHISKKFSYCDFLVTTPTSAFSFIDDSSPDIPNDKPQIGEVFINYTPLKKVSNVSFPFITNGAFQRDLNVQYQLDFSNETFGNQTSINIMPYLLEELILSGKYIKAQCEEKYLGNLVDEVTCQVYYKLIGVCLLFDSTKGKILPHLPAGCANYPNLNPYPYAQYDLIKVQSGESLRRVNSLGFFQIRDYRDPYVYLMSLNCNGGFCASKKQSGEILIVSGILLLLVIWIVPVFLLIAYCVLKEGTIYSLSDIQEKNDLTRPNPFISPESYYENIENSSKNDQFPQELVDEQLVEIKRDDTNEQYVEIKTDNMDQQTVEIKMDEPINEK